MILSKDPEWFKSATIYQIYPRSFCDSNGDGIGDLRGIISRLDYIKSLGVDAVWLCPVYASPNDDNGYDISDYRAIHPDFGTMADFDALLAGLHERGMGLIMDMVLNHCSDEHPWFQSARTSKASPWRDWFHWLPAGPATPDSPEGSCPRNWGSFFSGPAWDPVTDPDGSTSYYLHLFSRKQPDLNWENPALRQELYGTMRWWLDKGVDGFRLDVINLVSKVPGYPEGESYPGTPWTNAFGHVANGPRIHEFMAEMNREVFAPYGAVTVGEAPGVGLDHARLFTDPARKELDMVFQFDMMDLDGGPRGKFDYRKASPKAVADICKTWQEGLDRVGWNSLYWNNHDQPRPISRFGDPAWREASGKALAAFLYFQKGTAYVYQGEEIGMCNVAFRDESELRDIESLNFIRQARETGAWSEADVWRGILAKGRDNARVPFSWDAGPGAGFSTATPWIRLHQDAATVNAAESEGRPDSLLNFYRRVIAFRHQEPLISRGSIRFLDTAVPLVAYVRSPADGKGPGLTVALNWSSAPLHTQALPGEDQASLLTNYPARDAHSHPGTWRPWELRVWRS